MSANTRQQHENVPAPRPDEGEFMRLTVGGITYPFRFERHNHWLRDERGLRRYTIVYPSTPGDAVLIDPDAMCPDAQIKHAVIGLLEHHAEWAKNPEPPEEFDPSPEALLYGPWHDQLTSQGYAPAGKIAEDSDFQPPMLLCPVCDKPYRSSTYIGKHLRGKHDAVLGPRDVWYVREGGADAK